MCPLGNRDIECDVIHLRTQSVQYSLGNLQIEEFILTNMWDILYVINKKTKAKESLVRVEPFRYVVIF